MKLAEGKHNHTLTKLLKVCLFGLIMLLPFFAILPSTLYFAFNEHAQNYTHEEVIETYEYETNELNSVDDVVFENIYKFNNEISQQAFNDIQFTCYLIINKDSLLTIYDMDTLALAGDTNQYYEGTMFHSSQGSPDNTLEIYINDLIYVDFVCDYIEFDNVYLTDLTIDYLRSGSIISNYFLISDYLGEKNVEVVSSEQSPLNAFNTASNNVWNSPIFNWVNDGLGSIAIANMLVIFGIAQNTFISNILIYWLSITAIYIIIDIVITAFTILTHLITKKAE